MASGKDLGHLSITPDQVIVALAWGRANRLASVSLDNGLKHITIWDPDTCQEVRDIECGGTPALGVPAKACALAWSPDGKQLAYAVPQQVKVYDAVTGQELFDLRFFTNARYWAQDGELSIEWSPDGRRLLYHDPTPGSDTSEQFTIWDVASQQEVVTFRGPAATILLNKDAAEAEWMFTGSTIKKIPGLE
jgi:WD40 repeat protein